MRDIVMTTRVANESTEQVPHLSLPPSLPSPSLSLFHSLSLSLSLSLSHTHTHTHTYTHPNCQHTMQIPTLSLFHKYGTRKETPGVTCTGLQNVYNVCVLVGLNKAQEPALKSHPKKGNIPTTFPLSKKDHHIPSVRQCE
jgi:hypothetical protein